MPQFFRLTGALHASAIGDGFVIPLFEIDGGRDKATYVQHYQEDVIIGFDQLKIREDDIVVQTNEQRDVVAGDRPLFGFKSRTSGLLIGNIFYLRKVLGAIRADYREGSSVRRHVDDFLASHFLAVTQIMRSGESMPLVGFGQSMPEVVTAMTAGSLGIAGVMDPDGRLAGVITDGDLRRNLTNLLDRTAMDIMTSNPVTVPANMLVEDALRLLNDRQIITAFVTDEDRPGYPIGVVHIHDCMRYGQTTQLDYEAKATSTVKYTVD
ncbi:MAG: CBS domain-containing protein [Sphingobium sp.]|nr:CBS domain-containing protein [Sphingobium sp.]